MLEINREIFASRDIDSIKVYMNQFAGNAIELGYINKAFEAAIHYQNMEALKYLVEIKGRKLPPVVLKNMAFMKACEAGSIEAMEYLGIDEITKSERLLIAAQEKCIANNHLAALKLLGDSVNMKNFQHACSRGQMNIVEHFIESGIVPVHVSIIHSIVACHLEVMTYLVENFPELIPGAVKYSIANERLDALDILTERCDCRDYMDIALPDGVKSLFIAKIEREMISKIGIPQKSVKYKL